MSNCKSCGEEIIWMKTDSGKNIPVDAETVVDAGATVFDPEQMISHFATCRDANDWRKPKENK